MAYQQQDMGKNFMSRLSKLDRYVIKRHSEIYPPEEHLTNVLKLVSDVEEVMKQVSQEEGGSNLYSGCPK